MSKVAVLGCGPAGLLAAHAVHMCGHKPTIYSIKRKSPIGGAQFLHIPIPEVTDHEPDGYVNFVKRGHAEIYAQKIYGEANAPTSWGTYAAGFHPVWNLRKAYDILYARYEDSIQNTALSEFELSNLMHNFSRVVSAVPAKELCRDRNANHTFAFQQVWIRGEAGPACSNNMIVYDGTWEMPWYRQSRIFDTPGTEYPMQTPGNSLVIKKPLWTDCTCWNGVTRVGRYGKWKKDQLTHHAFEDVIKLLGGSK